MCRLGLVAALGLCVSVSQLSADSPVARRNPVLSVEDLYQLSGPRWPVFFSDYHQVSAAFSRAWIDRTTKQDRYSLWVAARRESRALEPGEPDARRPVFSPDGKWLAFISTRPRPQGWQQTPPAAPESDAAADIWLIPTSGGAARPLAGPEKPYGRVFHDGFFGRVAFSPDSRRLVFIADDGKTKRTKEEIAADVTKARPDGGEGYTGWSNAQVWIAHLDEKSDQRAAQRIERLTNDEVWYGDPQWTADGKKLVIVANKSDDREAVRYSINKNYDLWSIDVATRKVTQLTTNPGPDVSPRFMPDGKRLVYLSVPRKGSHRDVFNVCILTFAGTGVTSRTLLDYHSANASKTSPPAYPLPDPCFEGPETVGYTTESGVITRAVHLNLDTGAATEFQPDGKPVIGVRQRRLGQLLPPEDAFLRDRQLGRAQVKTWDNGEGTKIEGILTLPPEGIAKPPYKLLLHPHGGPHSRSALGFDFIVHLFAAHGYAVFQPNFRGSHGYGQKFIDADRGDFGGGDVRDILSGVDQLIKEGIVDHDRQFVYGTSYGGFLTTWLVGHHPTRFRAAVAQNAVTDLAMMWSLSDIPSWVEWEFGGRPFEIPGLLRKHSPLTYIVNVKTPTLILHSRDDRRCPLPMGQAFYKSLQARGVPTELVIYPDEGHGIRQPRHREDVLRRVLAWFTKYDRKSAK